MSCEALLTAAAQGLFPVAFDLNTARANPKSLVMSARAYKIRPAQPADLAELVALEQQCWLPTLQASVDTIQRRLQVNPTGQLVVVLNDTVVGVIYSQRINGVDALSQHTMTSVEALHQDNGAIGQLLAVNIKPDRQQHGLGDELLEFMLQYLGLMGVNSVVAVSLVKAGVKPGAMTLADYLQYKDEHGFLIDPILRFHQAHGASLAGVIPDYRLTVTHEQRAGIIIHYELLKRRPQRVDYSAVNNANNVSLDALTQHVHELILAGLGAAKQAAFSQERPLMEMGLDSADLLQLNERITTQFGISLPPAFFFQYNTAAKITAYLSQALSLPNQINSTSRRLVQHPAQAIEEAIALIGMACRLPGHVDSPEAFWQLLISQQSAISELGIQDRDWLPTTEQGLKYGGFIDDVTCFDAAFFRISAAEAELMDPQQRLLLELSWTALENAGLAASEVSNTDTGVFIGASGSDYARLLEQSALESAAHYSTGASAALLANRISYFFDWHGPSLTLDTACSSSLVAVHQAIKALRAGECQQALVGGVNLILHPANSIAYAQAGMLADDGCCKTFDARANGYVRSEGAVVLLLKPLSAAIADNNIIHAVLTGSATNHGGMAAGVTVPNPEQQARLLQAAWRNAGIQPQALSYIETHGTGTALGDPIEVQGIKQAFADEGISAEKLCGLGAVKTQLGHLEAAAGIVGLLKTVLCLKHQQLPGLLHFQQLNPHIELGNTPFYVVTEQRVWSANAYGRIAGVSSFGSGGANAHVVVSEYVATTANASTNARVAEAIFVLSAKTADALSQYVARYLMWLTSDESIAIPLTQLCFTLQTARVAMEYRLAIKVKDKSELITKLTQFQQQVSQDGVYYFHSKGITVEQRQLLTATAIASALSQHDLDKLALLWALGASVAWSALYSTGKPQCASLPTYPFAKKRYWLPTATPEHDAIAQPKPLVLAPIWQHRVVNSPTRFAEQLIVLNAHRDQQQRIQQLQHNAVFLALSELAANSLSSSCHVLWFAPSAGNTDNIAAQEQGVLTLFKLVKKLIAYEWAEKKLVLTLVTTRTQAVFTSEHVQPAHAGIHALGGVIAKEFPAWQIRLFDVDDEASLPIHDVLNVELSAVDSLALRTGQWFQRVFVPIHAMPAAAPVYKQRGVYVVLGGAGGVATAWSEQVITTYHVQLIWLGRRAMDAELEQCLTRLGQLGPKPWYIQADATELASLTQAYQTIKARYPIIHGVIHAATSEFDDSLTAMTEAHFRSVLAAKINTSVHLLSVFAEEELDFLLFLSSTVALDKTGGLSGYAVGCAFVDALALSQPQRYPVKTLNLGHFGIGTGARLSDASKTRLHLGGIRPLTVADAMPVLAHLIAGSTTQLALVKTLYPDTLPWLDSSLSYYHDYQAHQTNIQLNQWVRSESLPSLAKLSASSIFQHSQLEQDLLALLADLAQVLALNQLKPQGYLARWLAASQQWLTEQPLSTVKTLDQVWQHWQQTVTQHGYAPDLAAALNLVETCMRALPEILAEKGAATDVIFPNASMALVDGIYQNNRVSDYFNAVLAETLVKFIENQTPDRKLRILEIGAGTGGTTTRVLARLNDYRDVIAEYCYTDVSKAFLFLGQERFAADYPFLVTQRLDIEQPPESQGFTHYAYDVVIATNVLHATRDMRQTLAHVKTLLRGQGLLLLNEITTPSLYAHLTFGLLEGWWLSADDALRAPNTPILLPPRWLSVLTQQGFTQACQMTSNAAGLGQQVFAALSDGLIVTAPVSLITQFPAESVTMTAEPTQTTAAVLTTVTTKIKTIVASVLRMPVDAIDTSEALEAYGIDSILIVQMTNRLREIFADISRTVLFECQTVAALAEYCVKHYPAQAAHLLAPNSATAPANSTVTPSVQANRPLKKLRQSTESEAIAIIGMSCRFPGADTVDAFWQLLQSGGDAITEVPKQRWTLDDLYLADIEQAIEQGKSYCRWGGFIDNIDAFDAQFFNISPKEAMTIDPQERLFLQTAWAALEDAGITRDQLQQQYRQQVGVFAGITRTGFDLFGPELWQAGKTLYPHTSFSSVANRLSYFLNLRGPSVPVDTMCSSSLTAIHQASQSLLNHECDLALVGGVNIYQHPSNYVWLSAQRMLSKDGRCKSFGAGANGFVPGEGVAVLVLKRWSDALVDDDPIYAKIRATHINHGGKTNGYTVPNPLAQAELIRAALNKADVNARAVSYIEAHGTGTELGDPIEMTALTQAFSEDTGDKGFCALGSVKSNIGHLEAAAGVAGVIKTVLQLQHSQIVPSLHAKSANPLIAFANTPFKLATELSDWSQPVLNGVAQPRIAGVSSFGAGGANAHVVLEEYQDQPRQPLLQPAYALVLSAKNKDRLMAYAELLCQFITQHPELCLAELAYTLQIGREAMTERLAFTAASTTEVIDKLRAFLTESQADYYVGCSQAHKPVIQVLSGEPGIEQTLAQWFLHQRFDKLLTLWAQGLNLDWSAFYQNQAIKPRRISLPTYPFARQEHRLPCVQTMAASKLADNIDTVQHKLAAKPEIAKANAPVDLTIPAANKLGKPSGITLTAVSDVHTQFTRAPARGLTQLTPLSHAELSSTKQVRLRSHAEPGNDEHSPIEPGNDEHATAISVIEVIHQGQGIYQFVVTEATAGQGFESLFIDALEFLLTQSESVKVLVLSGLPVLNDSAAINRIETLLTQLSVPVLVSEQLAFSLLAQTFPELVWLNAATVEHALTLATIIADGSRLALTTLTQHFIQQRRGDISADWPLALIETDNLLAKDFSLDDLGVAKPVPLASEVVSVCRYDNGIVMLTLADKRAKNTFTPEFVDGVLMAFADIADAQCDKVVVLTGFDQYFACGGTQQGLLAIQQGLAKFTDEQSYCASLLCELPVIAAMQGHAIGAGWAMGLYCDMTLFSEESRYQSPYLRYGFTPGAGSTLIFPQKLGKALSFEILYSAQTYTGHELKQRGISQVVLTRERVLPSALAIAAALCQMPRERLIAEKQQRVQVLRQQLFTVFAQELAMHDKTFVHNPDVIAKISQHFAQSLSDANNNRTPSYGLKAQPAMPKPSSNELFNELRASLAEELYLKSDAIDPMAVFIDLGMDSISAVTWIRKLNKRFGLQLEATFIYRYPQLTAFAEFLTGLVDTKPTTKPALASDTLLTQLRQTLAAELYLPAEQIDEHAAFIDLGMDSISAVTWIRKLNKQFGLELGATSIYSHPNLLAFSAFVRASCHQEGCHQDNVLTFEPADEPALLIEPAPTTAALTPELLRVFSAKPITTVISQLIAPIIKPDKPKPPAIAVIGMAGQFPQAENLAAYWQNLAQGNDCVIEIPPERFDIQAYYHRDRQTPGKTVCPRMGVLNTAALFDPLFFNISPYEAELMDPQQRLFLMASWQCIENAGINPLSLSGQSCGVFVGCEEGDYAKLLHEQGLTAAALLGESPALLPARIAYYLNLKGPCLAIDTACSSALVALAQACDSLVLGHCELAIAGGVYVITGPEIHIKMSQSGMLSPDGRCYAFDSRANGFVPGEGVGAVLLKRLEEAERDGDPIIGVIRGWGVNQDGKTNGITAPNPEAQADLIKQVQQRFQLNPETITMLEAHGTGTQLGDPIEIDGLRTAFSDVKSKQYCALGSVKSNIGHIATAAGIASSLKVLLALQQQYIPPTIHYRELNEHIQLANTPFYISDKGMAWPKSTEPRYAAVSSFGFSGSNAHVVFSDYCASPTPIETLQQPLAFVLSAKSLNQLIDYAKNLYSYLNVETELNLTALAYTLQTGRAEFNQRLAVIASNADQLKQGLIVFYQQPHTKHLACFYGQIDGSQSTNISNTNDQRELAQHWVNGAVVDWQRCYANRVIRRLANVPGHPFALKAYWPAKNQEKPVTTSLADWQLAPLPNYDWAQRIALISRLKCLAVVADAEEQAAYQTFINQINDASGVTPGLTLSYCIAKQNTKGTAYPLLLLIDCANTRSALFDALNNCSQPVQVLCVTATDAEALYQQAALTHHAWHIVAIEGVSEQSAMQVLFSELLAYDVESPLTSGVTQIAYRQQQRWLKIAPQIAALQTVKPEQHSPAERDNENAVVASESPGYFIAKHWRHLALTEHAAVFTANQGLYLVNSESLAIVNTWLGVTASAQRVIVVDSVQPFDVDVASYQDIRFVIDLTDCFLQPKQHSSEPGYKWLLYQNLIAHSPALKLVYLTLGLQTYQNSNPSLAGASWAGLVKMLSAEYRHVQAKHIDIDATLWQDAQALWQHLMAECMTEPEHTELCYRAGQRYVPYLLTEQPLPTSPRLTLSPTGVYVITGATRGIGLELAEFLAEQGAKHLVLLGVTSLPPPSDWSRIILETSDAALKNKLLALQRVLAKAPSSRVVTIPLTELDPLTRYFTTIRQELGEIKGVIHCAGVYSDATKPGFIEKDLNGAQAVFEPKITGIENLHQLFQHDKLDFMLAVTSLTGVLPKLARGAADYALANAYVDFFMAYHAARGKPYLSVSWSDWRQTGAITRLCEARRNSVDQLFQGLGLKTFSNNEGRYLFASVLASGKRGWVFPAFIDETVFAEQQSTLLTVNVTKQSQQLQTLISQLTQWEHEQRQGYAFDINRLTALIDLDELKTLAPELIQRIYALMFHDEFAITPTRENSLLQTVTDTVVEVLKLEQVDVAQPLQNYGLDSITAMVLATRLEKRLGQPIKPRWLIDYATITALAAHLQAQEANV